MRLGSAAVGLAAAAGVAVLLRRRRETRAERVDVWLEDGSRVSLEPGPKAEPMLAAAREALAAARG